MQRISIFGGSFNPVHLGHLGIARRAVEGLPLDRLLFVPAKVNPFKVVDGAVAGEPVGDIAPPCVAAALGGA